MKNLFNPILFLLIITIAIITRFYLLGDAPAGLYLDEAGQGYSAYSLLLTGKDEFGMPYPFVFRSFLDFKTPVYIYLIVPLIELFGLTKFTVRLPSAIFSILTFPFLYLLIKNLLNKNKSQISIYQSLPTIACLLLAISPWHILFGRTNFEVNVSVFFLIAGLYYFLRSVNFSTKVNTKSFHPWYLVLSAILLAIAVPAYHSQRLVTPLMLLLLTLRYNKALLSAQFRKPIIVSLILGILISIPTISVMTTPGFLKRASGLNIFTNETSRPAGYLENYDGILEPLINSQLFLSTKEFSALYVSYFSPRNMFWIGDSGPRSSFPDLSTFFVWQFPFYVYGFTMLIKKKELRELRFFTLALLFISPLPAAVTRDPYSTIRSLNMVIPQIIIIALGVIGVYELMIQHVKYAVIIEKSNSIKRRFAILHHDKLQDYINIFLIPLVIIVVSFSMLKLWSSVIVLNEHYRAEHWNYGWQEVSHVIKTLDPTLPIIVDNARSEPYSQLIFFLKFDPFKYQNDNFEVTPDEYYTKMTRNKDKIIGNIITRPIDWENDTKREQYLIGDALSISDTQIKEHNLQIIKEVMYPDQSVAFKIVKVIP